MTEFFPRILIIEDDEDIRFLYETHLEESADLLQFSNGQEALDHYVQDSNFDLVITDQELPDYKGEEIVYKIKDINPDQRMALVTGFSFSVKFPPALKVKVFPKPVSIQKVVDFSLIGAQKSRKV